MKRFFAFMMTLSLVAMLSMCLSSVPSFAESGSPAESGTTEELSAEDNKKESGSEKESKPKIITAENESSPDNPIGDDSSYYDVSKMNSDSLDISAESAILMDATSGAVLYEKEADTKRYPASITKVMTALLVVENCDMDEIVTFSNEAVNGIEAGSSTAGINVGAELTVEDALYAMMLVSANEAAAALAEHVSGSVDAFADKMNQRAKELGCTGTHFTNPHGLPDEDHYTTAHDMALILRQAMKYDAFRKSAETITYTLEQSDTLNNTLELWNHSKILRENSEYYYEYAKGSKTGFTQAALNTLATYAVKDDTQLLCIILKDYGADSSYYDTSALFKWGFDKVKGIKPLTDADFKSLLSSAKGIGKTKRKSISSMKTSFNKDYYILVPDDFDSSKLKIAFELDESKKNHRLGYVTISSGKELIGRTPVTYKGTAAAQDASKPVSGDEDGLETAPNKSSSLSVRKILFFFLRLILAAVLIFVIMVIIRNIIDRRKPPKDFGRRSKARSQGNRHRSDHSDPKV